MDYSQNLALLIYLLGVPLFAFFFAAIMPRLPQWYKERELAAVKRAFHPDTTRGKAREARIEAEKARDEWYSMSRLIEALNASGQSTWAWLFLALLWPGFVALSVAGFVVKVFYAIYDAVDGTHVVCDACEAQGPWGWTFRRARGRAHGAGWAVALPTKEDLCPACATAEGARPSPS